MTSRSGVPTNTSSPSVPSIKVAGAAAALTPVATTVSATSSDVWTRLYPRMDCPLRTGGYRTPQRPHADVLEPLRPRVPQGGPADHLVWTGHTDCEELPGTSTYSLRRTVHAGQRPAVEPPVGIEPTT